MVGGRLRCLTCLFTCSAVLLLGLCLRDVEACSTRQRVVAKVGDTVEFSSCSPAEGVTVARWRYGNLPIADKDKSVSEHSETQFEGRFYLNPTNFSLTLRRLTLQDSGDFSFISEVNNKQGDTVTVTLQVREQLTKQPTLTGNSTWQTSTNSCTVVLECTTSDSRVVYKWTVRNQTMNGSMLHYTITAQDGDTTFTCTVHNYVSETSASKTVKCSNNTQEINTKKEGLLEFVLLLSLAAGVCLMIVIIVGIVVCACHSKRRRAGSDSNDLTVYADITDVMPENRTSSSMKASSLYETIDRRGTPAPSLGPMTVYDKIQFNRGRKTSVSPYQEVS